MNDYTKLIEDLRSASTVSTAWEKLMLDAATAIEDMAKHITEMHELVTVLQIDRGRLETEVEEQKQIAAHYEQSAKDWWKEACDHKAQIPHWVSVEDELPPSGTHVLACCEVRGICGHKSHYVCDAFHTDKKSMPCSYNDDIDEEYDEETDEYYFPVGWWEVIKNWDDYSCVAIEDFVTHWMPLPEPPQEVQE